jgi:hypothetical protein
MCRFRFRIMAAILTFAVGVAGVWLIGLVPTAGVSLQGELFYFEGTSESFYRFLMNYPAASREEALDKVQVLSSLMVASAREGSAGEITLKGDTITSELRLWGRPWRVLKVRVGHGNKFHRIVMINPVMKKVVN